MKLKSKLTVFLCFTAALVWVIARTGRANGPRHMSELGWIQPNVYSNGDDVNILVNKVESDVTQFPYSYYELPFVCPPREEKKPLHLSLNEVFRGDRKWESDYKLKFGEDQPCVRLCDRKTQPEGLRKADELIRQRYIAQWLIDDELPAATTFISKRDQKKYYAAGFPLGYVDTDSNKAFLYNHVSLVVRYHTIDINKHTIVGFEVYPKSVSDYHCPGFSEEYEGYELDTDASEVTYIPFTYAVFWREEFKVDWAHRWKFFMNSDVSREKSSQFHWISLTNSVIVVALMTSFLALILTRVRSDDNAYSVAATWLSEKSPLLGHLNLFTSMGIQFLFTVLGSLIISCSLNKLHNVRNSVLSMALVFFILGAYGASFTGSLLSAGLFTNFGISVLYGSGLPAFTLCIVLILNCIVWAKDSTNALPFGTIVLLIAIYFVVCVPLSVLGAVSAKKLRNDFSKQVILGDTKPSRFFLLNMNYNSDFSSSSIESNKTAIKNTPFILRNPILLTLIAGAPPLTVIYVELLFVYKFLWLEKTSFYYLCGFLLANIFLLCIIVCEISMIVCYLLMIHELPDLCGSTSRTGEPKNLSISWKTSFSLSGLRLLFEEVRNSVVWHFEGAFSTWRWKTFQAGGSVAWYFELYSLYYLVFVLHLRDFSSILLFVCYTALFNIMCWCAFGALGYLSSCWFLSRICNSRKVL
ncbi:LAFE_0B09164g1_1 [Lachancea fermentati]|uniref:Transmembrane 9 superfamily member n=1 Tax=Lachancea fermentati TaxID=4955 RepID=A0A1G4M8A7_LACFM|nr:LAFE_0B09164g1_1 [Lachancea fermentati]